MIGRIGMQSQTGDGAVAFFGVRRIVGHWSRRGLKAFGGLVLLYTLIVIGGLVPVNNDFCEAEDGVRIYVLSTEVHADIIVPIANDRTDWRDEFSFDDFQGDTSTATHVALGWGDCDFFLNTPSWRDLRVSTAARALFWPTDACMHVVLTDEDYARRHAREVRISNEQYGRLVEFLRDSFRRDLDGRPQRLGGASYGMHDAFYHATGRYHCLNTCNSWAGRAMRAAGIRTAWLTPLPKTVYLYLPDNQRKVDESSAPAAVR